MSELTFLPWLRSGAAGALQPASPPINRPDFKVTLTATRTADSSHTDLTPTVVDLRMLGPGDVLGLKPSQVIRTEPADGSSGVETEIFAAVEFTDPTLPWMFTPELESSDHQLRPWICLVVVRVQDGVTLDRASGRLTIASPADAHEELPDLSEAWAWAHLQYAGDLKTDAPGAAGDLAAGPSLTLSRLLSPRKLEANKQYIACVVPTYKDGVNAGLGQSSDPAGQAVPAWTASDHNITLPAYFSFAFSTGVNGDFRELAKLLMHPPDVSSKPDSGLGPRTLHVSHDSSSASLPMQGMLQPANQSGPMQPPLTWVTDWLRSELSPSGATPQLRPPLYGAMQAGIRPRDINTVAKFDGQPAWWKTLNKDPRMRVAAALGRRVVAQERESLVAAAWDQIEQTREVNALLSRAQLARSVTATLAAKHLPSGDTSAATLKLLQLTSPQASRMQVMVTTAGDSVGGSVLSVMTAPAAAKRLPAVASATYRSLTRPRGVHALRTSSGPTTDPFIPMAILRASLNAEYAVTDRVLAERLSPPAAAAVSVPERGDALRELAPQVTYPYGMFTPLAHLAPEAILPGASTIPPNTALTLSPNSELIAAYMVGLNTEIVRTLLWRAVPSDRRCTPFKTFWDVRGQTGSSGTDIKDITSWQPNERLFDEFDSGGGYLMLGMRAELLRRYPRTAVFAIKATQNAGSKDHFVTIDPSLIVQPTFTGMLPPDLRLFGFAGIQPADAIGSPGYFFVLQEQASETRFGSDPVFSAATPSHNHWLARDLGIAHPNAALVADKVRMPPVAVAIHARALLPVGS